MYIVTSLPLIGSEFLFFCIINFLLKCLKSLVNWHTTKPIEFNAIKIRCMYRLSQECPSYLCLCWVSPSFYNNNNNNNHFATGYLAVFFNLKKMVLCLFLFSFLFWANSDLLSFFMPNLFNLLLPWNFSLGKWTLCSALQCGDTTVV